MVRIGRSVDQPGMLGITQLINEAWSYEMNNDHEVALRLYKTAFNNVLDINSQVNTPAISVLPGISPFEIRSVADYLNHRSCYIQFKLNHPREAITQFKKYIDTFKQHTKSPEYAFEHSAWLSQQYLMFADLFHQAVANGTKASRTQHPGLYFYEAAMQMIERRKNITEYTNDNIRSNQMPVTNELLKMITTPQFVTFLRLCGWVCVDPDVGPPVAPVDQTQPKKIEAEEIDYSAIIIRALYTSVEYFEEWSRPRMQTYLNVLIADEYVASHDLPKAMALYNRSLSTYEKETWTPLANHVRERISSLGTRK